MERVDIKDSKGFIKGWMEISPNEIKYWGFTKGYIGRFDKTSGWWFWMSGPKVGQRGPAGDIGYSEVLKAEGTF